MSWRRRELFVLVVHNKIIIIIITIFGFPNRANTLIEGSPLQTEQKERQTQKKKKKQSTAKRKEKRNIVIKKHYIGMFVYA